MVAADSPKSLHSIEAGIRVIAFDAVGTLIYAQPSVTAVYCRVLNELSGRRVDQADVRRILGERLVERSNQEDLRSSEAAERRFWYDLIAELVADEARIDVCFEVLYSHFGLPSSWRCYNDVSETLSELHALGFQLVLASNFDERLNKVAAGLQELKPISRVVISSEIGFRKPAPQFFEIVCQQAKCRPDEVLFIGDDLQNDVDGAK